MNCEALYRSCMPLQIWVMGVAPDVAGESVPRLSTAATSFAAGRGVLGSLERKIDDASGDTHEVRRARSDPRTVNRPESRRTSNGEALRYETPILDRK